MDLKFLAKAKSIFLKILFWIFIIVLGLFVLVFIALQFPQVQKFLTDKAITFVEGKIDTEVDIKAIKLAFPKAIWLQEIYVEDQSQDTLLYCHSLKIVVDMLGLINREIQINNVKIDGITANVHKTIADGVANYQFIIDGFQDTTKVKEPDPDKEPWTFSIYGLQIDNARLRYHDEFAGMLADADIGHFDLDLDAFDLENMNFEIDDFVLEHTRGAFEQSPGVASEKTKDTTIVQDSSRLPGISFDDIELLHVELDYSDLVKGRNAHLILGKTILDADDIDLQSKKILLNQIALTNTRLTYTQNHIADSIQFTQTDTTKAGSSALSLDIGWQVEVDDIDIENLAVKYDDHRKKPGRKEWILPISMYQKCTSRSTM